jgi:hypothetical protein
MSAKKSDDGYTGRSIGLENSILNSDLAEISAIGSNNPNISFIN